MMNYIKRLFVLFQQGIKCFSRHPAVNALENSPLAKLPRELLQQIANDLPITAAVSFSLSCRQILLLIGTRHLENLATSNETLAFLKLIEHDLQNQIVCNSCKKLHKIQDARKYTERGRHILQVIQPSCCLVDDRKAMVTSYIHNNFSTAVFKMVMKHYHLFGYDTRSRQLLNLLSGEFHTSAWGTLIHREKAKCRIKNGSLFTCNRIAFDNTCIGIGQYPIWFWICPHLTVESKKETTNLRITSTTSYDPSLETWSLLYYETNTSDKKISWNIYSGFQRCRYCRTEYKASFEHNNNCTIKFTITIWKDLGQGPETDEWKAQLAPQNRLSFLQPIQFHEGEIASVFE